MFDKISSDQQSGRFPEEIKLLKVTLPKKLAHLVVKSQEGAGKEVTPKKTEQ